MRVLVTGMAGFIGSHLAERLVADGHEVVGVDRFSDYYARGLKELNLATVRDTTELVEGDLRELDLDSLVDGVDVVYHQAAQAGVRSSWGDDFATYLDDNVHATQRLLEACQRRKGVRFVYASSSSVYGDKHVFPVDEQALPAPESPYGVTKLAGEHLCNLYAALGVHTVSLRYFTVYGPRQRPDMAFHRLVNAAIRGGRFPMYGDGSQIRQFTHVDDIVAANVAAATAPCPAGTVVNVSGGVDVSLAEVISMIERLTGREVTIDGRPASPGDVRRTGGDAERAKALLGWQAGVGLEEGLRSQIEWHESQDVLAVI